ncbi:MAG: hypothetical protein EB084_05535 [Proteobacteria bacterium]|nr:hypothetical protein [Pseudomonadota bacterium]
MAIVHGASEAGQGLPEASENRPPTSDRVAFLAAALGYLLLALAFTWPVCLHLNERLLGSPNTDVCVGVWGFWWYHHALSGGQSPFSGDVLGFPNGGLFFVADPLNALLSVPVQRMFDLVTSYNLIIVANLLLSALATFALLRYLRLPSPAAFVGGTVYAFNVYVASYIQNGVSQEIAIGWLPLFVLRFLIVLRNGGLANLAWASGALALTVISSWYHAACAFLLLPLLSWPFRARAQALRWSVWTVICALIVVTPFLVAQLRVLGDFHTLEVRQAMPLEASLETQDGSDIARFVTHAADSGWVKRGYVHAASLGWVALGLAAWGLMLSPTRAAARRWTGVAVVFLSLAAGFVLEINGWIMTIAGRLVPLPFLFLYRFLPGFSWLGFPHRFVVPALLALACMAAYGAAALQRDLRRVDSALLGVSLSLTVFLELALLAPLVWPIATTRSVSNVFYARAGASTEHFGIIDLPTTSPQAPVAKHFFYYQTLHGKGIPYGIDATIGRRFPGSFSRNPALGALPLFDIMPGFVLRRLDARAFVSGLHAIRYRYIVLHTSYMSDVHVADLRLFLEKVLPPPEKEGDLLIYTVP